MTKHSMRGEKKMTIGETVSGGALTELSRWSNRVLEDRVHRTLYTDPAVFEEEIVKVFGGQSWVYLAHESQLPKPHSYL